LETDPLLYQLKKRKSEVSAGLTEKGGKPHKRKNREAIQRKRDGAIKKKEVED